MRYWLADDALRWWKRGTVETNTRPSATRFHLALKVNCERRTRRWTEPRSLRQDVECEMRKGSSSKQKLRCAASRCSAVRSAALQLVVCCCVEADVASRRLLKCPPPPLKANCRKLPAAMIQLNCLHCAGVRKSKRE